MESASYLEWVVYGSASHQYDLSALPHAVGMQTQALDLPQDSTAARIPFPMRAPAIDSQLPLVIGCQMTGPRGHIFKDSAAPVLVWFFS